MKIGEGIQPNRGRRRERSLWDKTWRDNNGQTVIYQQPSLILIGWAVLAFISLLVPRGKFENVTWFLSAVVLVVWSLLEIFRGANYFRRVFGFIVLVLAVATLFGVGL